MWNEPIIEELHKIQADRDAQFKRIEQEWLLKFPKLMSGEIRVKDAEKMAEDVVGSIAVFTVTLIIRHRI
ncbi:hypothetical protein LQF76_07185 [Gloeomargaritales cyanobacterium VI4D9]|nr:hypothetical protein LQF76_07185 [Gloeomargaritales cyanobacterium VI4D9]